MAVVDVNKLIPEDIEKLDRDNSLMTFLDVTPSATTMQLEVLGIGITDYGISYNPQVDQEKWIIEKNARNVHESNQKQGSVEQKIYKGDKNVFSKRTKRIPIKGRRIFLHGSGKS